MFNQDFQMLTRNELDVQLSQIFRHWEASPIERAEFVGWAWVVASACDFSANSDGAQTHADLKAERDSIHRELSLQLVHTSVVNSELVSKRMFIDWLLRRLERARQAA